MSTILKNVVHFTGLVGGVPVTLPHLLNVNGVAVAPQLAIPNQFGFTVTANTTGVTVTRTTGTAAVDVYIEHWHTIEDLEPLPGGITPALLPFIAFGGVGATPAPPASSAMFFGTTTGTGSAGNDYAATVAVGAAVPFPRDGAAIGTAVTRSSATQFLINVTGIYRVSWGIEFAEASQMQVALNATPVANTCHSSTTGTAINSGTVLVSATAAQLLTLINPSGNATALTVVPADGNLTHAQAPSIVIELVG